MKRDLRLERVYPQAPDRVWRALTDRERLSRWLMETDFEPRLGHKFTFRSKPRGGWDGLTYCEVTELEPPRRLAYTWRGGPGDGKPLTLDTIVRFTLEPEGSGTRLVLEHTGFSGFKSILVSVLMKSGWAKMMRGKLAAEIAAT
jgi:uncharacterized protein YndB with AHSA1/START domain